MTLKFIQTTSYFLLLLNLKEFFILTIHIKNEQASVL